MVVRLVRCHSESARTTPWPFRAGASIQRTRRPADSHRRASMKRLSFGYGEGVSDVVERRQKTTPEVAGIAPDRLCGSRLPLLAKTAAKNGIEHFPSALAFPLCHRIDLDQQIIVHFKGCSHASKHANFDALMSISKQSSRVDPGGSGMTEFRSAPPRRRRWRTGSDPFAANGI